MNMLEFSVKSSDVKDITSIKERFNDADNDLCWSENDVHYFRTFGSGPNAFDFFMKATEGSNVIATITKPLHNLYSIFEVKDGKIIETSHWVYSKEKGFVMGDFYNCDESTLKDFLMNLTFILSKEDNCSKLQNISSMSKTDLIKEIESNIQQLC